MKTRIIRFAAASVTALGFLAPGAASAYNGTIDTTGPDSRNEIRNQIRNEIEFDTENRIDIDNFNRQTAVSGDATVRNNSRVDDVTTGDAANFNETVTHVNVKTHNSVPSNWGGSGVGSGTIRYTGPDSRNEIHNDVRNEIEFDTENDIDIHNHNDQTAVSGDATVRNNSRVGNVRTGDAVNENYTEFRINVETVNN